MGAGIALALSAAGSRVELLVRSPRPTPSGVGLCVGEDRWGSSLARAAVVVVATPDAAISAAAEGLRAQGVLTSAHVVLHLSGLLDRNALSPLDDTGAALGSWHPLQAVADAAAAPELLRGAYAVIEGDAQARVSARELARHIGMLPLELESGAKASYHAAAALVSNYTVTLADLAARIAEGAGVPTELARRMYLPLLQGTVDNIERQGTAAALTGAIRRGDAATVAAHLVALGNEARPVYVALGLATLRLAREAGLEHKAAEAVETVLRR